jgi:hypothetical protein
MKILFNRLVAVLILVATIGTILMSTGCVKTGTTSSKMLTAETAAKSNTEGFAIYLTKDNIPSGSMPALDQTQIADTPLVALSDIVTYNSLTHIFTLTDSAANRISNLPAPLIGTSFVVCVNRQPVYWGAFWSPVSSAFAPASGITVYYPLSEAAMSSQFVQTNPRILELDYSGNNDPRNSPTIIASLQQAGKLNNEGFAIYFPQGDVSPQNMPALTDITLPAQPFISSNDIVSYDSTTYKLALTPAAFSRLIALQAPVYGKPFVVCVDRNPIYCGAFWSPISSVSFNGITIAQPLNDQTDIVTIQLGYPAQSLFTGVDPRNNTAIIDSLSQTGKLTFVQDNMLPHSMDGYELYSWQQGSQWNYTLITGTNRDKTTQEIITANNTVTSDGWVNIHVTGLDALEAVFNRIPHSDFVSWVSGRPADSAQFGVTFAIPPADILSAIKTYADRYGLNLIVFSPNS